MHDVFAEALFSCQQTEDEQNKTDVGGDEGGFMDGTRKEKSSKADSDIKKGEKDSDFCHAEF